MVFLSFAFCFNYVSRSCCCAQNIFIIILNSDYDATIDYVLIQVCVVRLCVCICLCGCDCVFEENLLTLASLRLTKVLSTVLSL